MSKIIKITYWGIAGCGKTTIVDTLHKLTTEEDTDLKSKGNLIKIARDSGATLYYDRGIFYSRKNEQQLYNVVTVAGQRSFGPIRKRVFKNTDGCVFVVDSQTKFFEDNIESLKELKSIADDKLIKSIPLIIMLNKQDLTEIIKTEDFKQILKEEKLWYEPDNELMVWNPMIYETCALYDQRKDIYRSFYEIVRRTTLYRVIGNGKAPVKDNLTIKI
ncbi:MAG: ADP-ribosylation factor-like protein [Promethearchaeota archaeon]